MPKKGYKQTEEHKEKLSLIRKGRHLSPNTEFKRGNILSAETRRKIGLANLGEKNHNWLGGKKDFNCEYCGKWFKRYEYVIKSNKYHFCSYNCRDEHHSLNFSGKNHPNWLDGLSLQHKPVGYKSQVYREKIRQRDAYRCQECFRHQDELHFKDGKPRKLDVHHIDYSKKNNEPSNLISLCHNCHSQTGFNRDNWIKYFSEKVNKSV